MNKILGLLVGVVLASVFASNANAAVYTALNTGLGAHVTEATTVVGTLVLAGLGIFALIWGIRKFKSAVKAGA